MIRVFKPGFNQDDDVAGLPLFSTGGASAPPVVPQDPRVRGTVEEPRLSKQSQAILDRLRQRPASNSELMLIAQRFGARVHDLRAAGFNIQITERDRETGMTWYALEKP
jgi:hypothetical protein